ncbi:MAG: F0F1 ATP synthase subunit A [Candidatus Sulfotelmatobacter sp.]|jgi:F-type H+-transporting ATPase subunit a
MPEQLWFTAILNRLLASPVTSLLRALHIEPRYPTAPISNSFAMEVLVFSFLLVLFFLVRSRLSVDRPGALQHAFEGVEGFIQGQSDEIIGHHSEGYTPFLAALGFFILFCNLIGVIPGFESPTAIPVVPLGCALCAFVYYQTQGFKHAGIGYLKHFLGPSDPTMSIFIRLPLALLMLPIELISHLARVLSLTIRLFANMFAGDMVTLVFFSLVPLGVPILFLGLHIGVSLLQTYIFVLLTTVYLSGAVSEEH